MVYQCEKQLGDLGDKAPADLKSKIESLLADSKKVLEDSSASNDDLKKARETLQKGFEELGQEVMKNGGMPGAEAAGAAGPAPEAEEADTDGSKKKDDDIVDADFEVVDDDKKEAK